MSETKKEVELSRVEQILNLLAAAGLVVGEAYQKAFSLIFTRNTHLTPKGFADGELSHNITSDTVPVADDRIADVPLVLNEVKHKGCFVGYIVVPDKACRSLEHMKAYADLYCKRRVLSKGGMSAWVAYQVNRQTTSDHGNSLRGRAKSKSEAAEKYAAFIGLSEEEWTKQSLVIANLPKGDEIVDAIDELRAEAQS